jgi:uncharacterized protein YegP (UPF0339 family)
MPLAAELTTHQSRSGEWGFRFTASDGRVLARGEDYVTWEDMWCGVEEARVVLRANRIEVSVRDWRAEPSERRTPTERSRRSAVGHSSSPVSRSG